jgi:hypothetical protein
LENERRRVSVPPVQDLSGSLGWQETLHSMKRGANYQVKAVTEDSVFIRDMCNEMGGMSVTNAAEEVVAQILENYGNKHIIYQDTEGQWDELIHDGTQFTDFGPFRGTLPENL